MKKYITKPVNYITLTLIVLQWLFLASRPAVNDRPHAIIYRGGQAGRVIFDHQVHASGGIRCYDCHTDYAGTRVQLFSTRKQGLITEEDHEAGVKCFVCHNGRTNEGKGVDSSFLYRWDVFYECARCHYRRN